jgi:hypothetical protein
MLLKNLAFLCHIGVWLVKSRYSTWTVYEGTADLAKNENCKIWDSRLMFKNE